MADERTPDSRSQNTPPRARNSTLDISHMSPPPSIPSSSQSEISGKIKKKATVTPRTFTRFFTPRSSLNNGNSKRIRASRQALRDITASVANKKNATKKASRKKDGVTTFGDDLGFKDVRIQKRKALDTPETTPDRSSPSKKVRQSSFSGQSDKPGMMTNLLSDSEDGDNQDDEDSADDDSEEVRSQHMHPPKPLIRSRYHGRLGGVLRREQNTPLRFMQATRFGYGIGKLTESRSTSILLTSG